MQTVEQSPPGAKHVDNENQKYDKCDGWNKALLTVHGLAGDMWFGFSIFSITDVFNNIIPGSWRLPEKQGKHYSTVA